MSDYMFMLENHLTPEQNRVLVEVESAAAVAGVNLFLSGGAVRDMIGGFPIRDLDFTVEGPALKIAKTIAQRAGGEIVSTDEHRKRAELRFPGGVTAEIGMARLERFGKPGAKPQVTPATIHEDLRGRDFTVNSLALSLNRASRGLLLDPNNGLSDLERRELRASGNYTLYDDPIRLLRLIRFRVRLGFEIAERTRSQYENARAAEVEKTISPQAFNQELLNIAAEPNPGDILQALEQEKLLPLIAPFLAGAKLNLPGFAKLLKARQLLPFGVDVHIDSPALFFYLLNEKLTPKERTELARAIAMDKSVSDRWQKLEARAKKLEKELKASGLQKPSALYHLLVKAPGEQVLFLLVKSTERLVLDRIRNYYQKYLPAALEITDRDVVAAGGQPGTPKFQKLRDQLIAAKLDARPKKPPTPPVEEPPPAPAPAAPGRGGQPSARKHA
jgi:tRNA nucleotidyltransferase/poly(A) polymerase